MREPRLGDLLGSMVLGFAHLGSRRYGPARAAFDEVTARLTRPPVQMDWIFNMPLQLGLAECWLGLRAPERARAHADSLCRLAESSGERTYLALGRCLLTEAALAWHDVATAYREIVEALRSLEGHEAPLAEWRVCATAARCDEARGRRGEAGAHWARSASAIDRLAASLDDEPDLRQTFDAHPAVRAIRARAAL